MGKIKASLLSSIAALLVQPPIFLAWMGIPALVAGETVAFLDMVRFSPLAAVFAIPFVVVVGIPAALLLSRDGRLRWAPLALVGTLAAILPLLAIIPGGSTGYSSGGNWHGKAVDYVVNGKPTLYGWLSYFESLVYFGLHGFIGASAFYAVWRRSMGPNNSFKPNLLRSIESAAKKPATLLPPLRKSA